MTSESVDAALGGSTCVKSRAEYAADLGEVTCEMVGSLEVETYDQCGFAVRC